MKNRLFCIIIIIICSISVYAQKSKTPKGKSPVVTEQERKLSVYFADGVKEFYSQNYQEAEVKFRHVIAENPKNAAAFFMLSKIYLEKKDYSEALHNINSALALEKNNVWYMIALAKIYDTMHKYSESVKYWSKICDLNPQNEYYLMYYAEACLYSEKFKEVINVYTRLENLLGKNEEITAAKVELWLHLNDVKSAVHEYDMLIAENPDCETCYLKAAQIYISNEMPDKASPYFEKALKINPDNAEVQLTMASYYEYKGNKQAAFQAYLKAFQTSSLPIEKKLPVLRSYLKTLPISQPTTEQYALAKALTEVNYDAVEGWAAMGTLLLKDKKYEQASSYFEKALTIDVSQFALWSDYLYCLAQSKNYSKIIEKESDIVELFPTSSMMNYTLGVAYLNTENPQTAIVFLEKALKLSFDIGEKKRIYKMIGNAYHELKDEARAQEYWNKSDGK